MAASVSRSNHIYGIPTGAVYFLDQTISLQKRLSGMVRKPVDVDWGTRLGGKGSNHKMPWVQSNEIHSYWMYLGRTCLARIDSERCGGD